MNKIFIFDIDGAICENIFPNLMPSNQHPEAREQVVKEVNEKGWNIELYPEFLRYYYNNCGMNDVIYFVTGRQRHRFDKLTYHQLSELHYKNIIFYPKAGLYQKDMYLTWKCTTIQKLLKKGHEHYIFDAHNDYFKDVDPQQKYTIHFIKCARNEDWGCLNNV